jgi:hypothetical protein
MTKFPNHIYMIIFDSRYLGNVVVVRVSPKMLKVLEKPQDAHGISSVSAEDAHITECWGFIDHVA